MKTIRDIINELEAIEKDHGNLEVVCNSYKDNGERINKQILCINAAFIKDFNPKSNGIKKAVSIYYE